MYVVSYQSDNTELLKTFYLAPPSLNQNILIKILLILSPYGLVQYTTSALYKEDILQHNHFLHKLDMISTFNMIPTILYFEIFSTLNKDHHVKGIE